MFEDALVRVFDTQDRVLKNHLENSPYARELLNLVSRGTSLTLEILANLDFAPAKVDSLFSLTRDSLSHIVVASRLGLWGISVESMAVLRGAVESATILEYLVEKQQYDAFDREMEGKFRSLSFDKVSRALGERGLAAGRFHGRISGFASHTTPARLRSGLYDLQGETSMRLGFAFDQETAEFVLKNAAIAILVVLRTLAIAFDQEGKDFPWGDEAFALVIEYEDIEALREPCETNEDVRALVTKFFTQ